MKFLNVAPHDLKFQIDGVVYEVPVGCSCDVPDKIAYAIESRGLPMKPVDELTEQPAPAPVASDEETPKVAKRGRAQAAPVASDEETPKKRD